MARRGLSLRVRVMAVALAVVLAPIIVVGAAGLRERGLVSGMRSNVEAAVLAEAESALGDEEAGRAWVEEIASDRAMDALPASEPLAVCDGSRNSSNPAMTRPDTPITIQNALHGAPDAMIGPTTNCPADPPAMPNICVAPIKVAARDAGKLVVAM